jgi:hypothetical protein
LREEENAEKIRGLVDLTEKQLMIGDACPDPEQCENRGDEPTGGCYWPEQDHDREYSDQISDKPESARSIHPMPSYCSRWRAGSLIGVCCI